MEAIKKIFKSPMLYSITALLLGLYLLAYIGELESTIEETAQTDVQGLYLNINNNQKEIKKLKEEIENLKIDINQLKAQIQRIEAMSRFKLQARENNIFLSEALKEFLNQIKEENDKIEIKEKKAKELKTKFKKLEPIQLDKVIKKVEKKKKQKYHIYPPKLLKVTSIQTINEKVYLTLKGGQTITVGAIYQDDFKVVEIDVNNNVIILKNINKNSFEYGKQYVVPFTLEF